MDTMIALIISSILSLIIAFLTATFKTNYELKKEKIKREYDVTLKQKYDYFLPFKYCADEFRERIRHIVYRLKDQKDVDIEKHYNMINRFKQDLKNKKKEWFFNDSIGPEGGYFFISTIYMNCMLLYWISQIQNKLPYIPLNIDDSKISKLEKFNKIADDDRYLNRFEQNCEIYNFIINIKVLTSGEKGIPFGLLDSYGDFMYNRTKEKSLNYEEFSDELLDESKRIKFNPVIKFWLELLKDDETIDEYRIEKLRRLILLLEILEDTNIREV